LGWFLTGDVAVHFGQVHYFARMVACSWTSIKAIFWIVKALLHGYQCRNKAPGLIAGANRMRNDRGGAESPVTNAQGKLLACNDVDTHTQTSC